ncbi:hypothetical protein [Flavobacterium oreochromis]|uniref:Transposase n=1 Tax=Flavobacterium oreochromis TaxID=2906078 RepID=A0ABW8P710_9FLAO
MQVTKDGGKTSTNVLMNILGLPKNTWCYHIEAREKYQLVSKELFDLNQKLAM